MIALIEDMKAARDAATSMFAAQLLKEDISRLERLQALLAEIDDWEAFRKQAMTLGWTAGDMRTFELRDELERFLDAVFRQARQAEPADMTDVVQSTWAAFYRRRMDKLVGCLSRP